MAVDKLFKPKKHTEIPEGSHLGLFQGLVHLGIQRGEYEGTVTYKDQLLLQFELPDIVMDNGSPAMQSLRMTNSTSTKSNMLKFIKAIRGGKNLDEGVDFEELLGKPVMLSFEANKDRTAVNIKGFMSVPDALKKTVKPLVHESILLLDVERIGDSTLKKLPEWVQKVINQRVKDDNNVDTSGDY